MGDEADLTHLDAYPDRGELAESATQVMSRPPIEGGREPSFEARSFREVMNAFLASETVAETQDADGDDETLAAILGLSLRSDELEEGEDEDEDELAPMRLGDILELGEADELPDAAARAAKKGRPTLAALLQAELGEDPDEAVGTIEDIDLAEAADSGLFFLGDEVWAADAEQLVD